MKKTGIFLVKILSILFVLGSLVWIGYQAVLTVCPEVGYRFMEYKSPTIRRLERFGDQGQFISFIPDKPQSPGGYVTMSQNYLVQTAFKTRTDGRSDRYKIDPGETLEVTTYELNSPDFKQKRFDLLPILRSKGFNYQVFSLTAVTYKERDYLWVYSEKDALNTVNILYDIGTSDLVPLPKDLDDMVGMYTVVQGPFSELKLPNILDDNFDISFTQYSLNDLNNKAKNLDTTNLFVEQPEIAKSLTNGGAVYVRPLSIDEATWFNTVIHWFAPKGQDVMELYATDKATGEKTQIKSYADFEAWKAAHPDNDAK